MSSARNLITLSVATCWLLGYIAVAKSESVNHRLNYYKINEYLESKIEGSNDNGKSMLIVSEWLKSLENTRSESLIESIRLFVSLSELTDPSTCNEKGYKILIQNNEALNGLSRYGIRAIDRMALDYAQRHANACCGEYEKNFNRKVVEMDTKNLELVKSFARKMTEYALDRDEYPNAFGARTMEKALRSSPINFIRLMDDDKGHRRSPNIEAFVLREFLDEVMNEPSVTEDSVRRAYANYLEQPCREYTDTIGSDIFEPVVLDEITRLDSRGKVLECNDGSMDYRLGLAYHKVCQMYILGRDNLLPYLIKSIS